MTKQVQRRRGTSTQHTSFAGAEGEISVNTTNKSVHVHDGSTAGGFEAARADLGNVSDANLNSALAGNTLSSLTVTTADINGGTIDGTIIGAATPAAGTFTQVDVTGGVIATGTLSSSRTSGYGAVEVGGPSGGLIDLKAPFSDDYDARIIYNAGAELQIVTLADNEPILLRQGSATKLQTKTTGVGVTGTITGTADARINGLTVGRGAGDFSTNTAVGNSALESNNSGVNNTAQGYLALQSNLTGSANTAHGLQALRDNQTGVSNTAVGLSALKSNIEGDFNTAVGRDALKVNLASSNIAVGRDAGSALTTGPNNTIIGSIAGTAGLANTVIIGAGTTERMRIDSSGHAIIPGGVTLGTATGVYSAANTLDDYEEGTWNPVISDGTNNATSDVDVATYTKIGNHVHVQGRIRLSSLGAVSGAIRLTGLPFSSKSLTNNFGAMTVGRATALNLTAGSTVCGDLRASSSQVLLLVWDSTVGNTTLQATEFSPDGDISFSMDYLSN